MSRKLKWMQNGGTSSPLVSGLQEGMPSESVPRYAPESLEPNARYNVGQSNSSVDEQRKSDFQNQIQNAHQLVKTLTGSKNYKKAEEQAMARIQTEHERRISDELYRRTMNGINNKLSGTATYQSGGSVRRQTLDAIQAANDGFSNAEARHQLRQYKKDARQTNVRDGITVGGRALMAANNAKAQYLDDLAQVKAQKEAAWKANIDAARAQHKAFLDSYKNTSVPPSDTKAPDVVSYDKFSGTITGIPNGGIGRIGSNALYALAQQNVAEAETAAQREADAQAAAEKAAKEQAAAKQRELVKSRQNILNNYFITDKANELATDGIYDQKTQAQIKAAQEVLQKAGLYKDKIDGVWGKNTEAAMQEYIRQQDAAKAAAEQKAREQTLINESVAQSKAYADSIGVINRADLIAKLDSMGIKINTYHPEIIQPADSTNYQ